jgi:hypothetical protein
VESNTVARSRFSRALPFLVAFVVSLTFIPAPREPYVLDDSLSEKTVLSYANQQKWQYGSDIIFTYGPWGYLVTRYFFPHHHHVQMLVLALLSWLVATGVCVVAFKLNPLWAIVIIVLFVYLNANIDPRADLLIYSGLLCWGWLCMITSGRSCVLATFCFALLAVFGVMVKANFLFVVEFSIIVIFMVLLLKARLRFAVLLPLAVIVIFLFAWSISGQSLNHLPAFFVSAWDISKDYDQVVGLDGPVTFRIRGLLAVFLAVGAIITRALAADTVAGGLPVFRFKWYISAITAWLLLLVFVVWKHSFVRADLFHMGFVFGLLPLLVLSLELIVCCRPGLKFCSRALALGTCVVALVTLQSLFFASFGSSFIQPFAALRKNLSLFHPETRKELNDSYREAQKAARLPALRRFLGTSTVDVFGNHQCYALLNEFSYRPRPVFQSYLTFNDKLMALNEHFYFSEKVPDYMLLQLNAGDRVFPPLQDARLFRHVLLNFELVMAEKPFLLLQSKSAYPAKLKMLRQEIAQVNELIALPQPTNDLIWVKLFVQSELPGEIRRMLYKPEKVRIGFWSEDGKTMLMRSGAPVPMMAAGFVASPLFFLTRHVQEFFEGTNSIRPAFCSVEMTEDGKRWYRPSFRYEVYAVENSRSAVQGMKPGGLEMRSHR